MQPVLAATSAPATSRTNQVSEETMIRNWTWALVAVSLLASCASVSDVERDVRGQPPAALTVAVKPVVLPASQMVDGELDFSTSPNDMRDGLVAGLQRVNAASRIVPYVEGQEADYDVIVAPQVNNSVQIQHAGSFDGPWLGSTGLWLVTWIGGMVVDDAQYDVNLNVNYTVRDALGTDIVPAQPANASAVDTSFFERNDFFSWPTLQSVIIPPFLTSDQEETTERIVTDGAIESVATNMASYLKSAFEVNAPIRLAVLEPGRANGSTIQGDTVDLALRIAAPEPVALVRWQLNSGEWSQVTDMDASDDGENFYAEMRESIQGLAPGENFIRVQIVAGEQGAQRTFRFVRV